MKLSLILLSGLFLGGCAIPEKESSMSQYAYQAEKSKTGGVVTHIEHTIEGRFQISPKEYAEGLMKDHCPGGYEETKVSFENKPFHVGMFGATNVKWKTIEYKCK